jgi:hypothetical protein
MGDWKDVALDFESLDHKTEDEDAGNQDRGGEHE